MKEWIQTRRRATSVALLLLTVFFCGGVRVEAGGGVDVKEIEWLLSKLEWSLSNGHQTWVLGILDPTFKAPNRPDARVAVSDVLNAWREAAPSRIVWLQDVRILAAGGEAEVKAVFVERTEGDPSRPPMFLGPITLSFRKAERNWRLTGADELFAALRASAAGFVTVPSGLLAETWDVTQ